MDGSGRLSKYYMTFIFIVLYMPILLVVAFSFNDSPSSTVWNGFTLHWYADMPRDSDLLGALWVSLRVAAISAGLSAVIGTVGAVALGGLKRWSRTAVTGLSYAPLIIPEIVLGIALLMVFAKLPVRYGMTTLILAHMSFCVPYVMFMVRVRLKGIDPSIMEAAVDLGASPVQSFLTITLPLVLPATASGALLAAAMSLDDVVISFFVAGPGSTTLPIKVFSMLKLGVTPRINALCAVLLLVTFMLAGLASYLAGGQGNANRKDDGSHEKVRCNNRVIKPGFRTIGLRRPRRGE